MSDKVRKIFFRIFITTATGVALFVFLTALSVENPFPFSTCFAPWFISNRYTCVVEAARRLGNIRLCDNFDFVSAGISREGCAQAVATFQQDPNICVQSLSSDRNPTRDADIDRCLWDFQLKLRRTDLCERMTDSAAKELCLRAYRKATEP